MRYELLFTGGHVITPEGRLGPDAAVAVDNGCIAAVGSRNALGEASREIDLDGRYLLPGIVDDHVHTREPGDEHKEDWETATRAAAAGGVTTLIAMPNTDPMVDSPEILETVFGIADERALVDFQSYAVMTSGNHDRVRELAHAGAAGFKVFLGTTFGEIEPPDDGELVAAMNALADTGKRVGFHEENDEILTYLEEQAKSDGRNHPKEHARSRPVIAEAEAVSRTTLFSEYTGCPVHMFHLSSGSAAEIVTRGKNKGINVSAETCPHYLWFTDDVFEEKGDLARIQPPIRDSEERARLWRDGILGKGVDCIATDHAPHTDEEKGLDDPFENTWMSTSGAVGLETQVPAMLTFIDNGDLSLERWIQMHSRRPAKLWGMYPEKGSLRVGTDADFTVVDPNVEWTLNRKELRSRSTGTPFHEETFTGQVSMTVVRGEIVFETGEVTGNPGHGERVQVGPTIDASNE